jgi:hypothetical protein
MLQLAKQSLDEAPYINCPKLSRSLQASPSVVCLSSPRSTYLGFLTEGKLAAILIILSSWGSQWAGHSPRTRNLLGTIKRTSSFFSGAVAGEEVEDLCKGSFSHTHPLLCYCFALLNLFYLHRFISKTQKN